MAVVFQEHQQKQSWSIVRVRKGENFYMKLARNCLVFVVTFAPTILLIGSHHQQHGLLSREEP